MVERIRHRRRSYGINGCHQDVSMGRSERKDIELVVRQKAPHHKMTYPNPSTEVIEYEILAGCGHYIATYRKDWKPKECKTCRARRRNAIAREKWKRMKFSTD